MTQRYIFFNSALGDERTYQASDFAEYFGSVLSTGLLHTDNVPGMSVSVETGTLNTVVSAGKAIMKGHFYDNTADLTLTHAIPEATLNRIDRIVLRLDLRNSERNILLHVKTGVASSTPVAPVLQRDNFIHEISLAQILVRANTVQLLAGDLIDERLDENLAGLVYSLISIPTSQFQAEWDAWFDTNTPVYQAEWQNFIDTLAGQSPVMSVNGVTPDVNGNVDAGGGTAEEVTVADVGGYYAGGNAELVLQEVGQMLNATRGNLVTSVNTVLGS